MNIDIYANQFPHLFQEVIWPWGPTKARFVTFEKIPPNYQIANVNLVPRVGDYWVMIKLADGSWEIPGGTSEPDEGYMETIHRELMEEVGAEMVTSHVIGAWDCFSLSDKPYRPYLPHPHFYRLVLTGAIKIVTSPVNPSSAERTIVVEAVPLNTAVERFIAQERYDLAELYQLASSLSDRKSF